MGNDSSERRHRLAVKKAVSSIMAQSLRANAMAGHQQDSYRDAGVDTDEADSGLQKLTARITQTWPPANAEGGVQLKIGYFANVINIGGLGIAISTDGIGSKAMIASALGKYDTVGIDCVAMNVNDVVCVGAKPVSMVDYIAVEKADAKMMDAISVGLCVGAKLADISISGGETAQLKDMVHGFDLAGTAIGYVALDQILVGQGIKDGDALIGIESNGVHSNGLSLVRHALFERNKYKLSHRFDELNCDIGTELLRPTHIYVREALELLNAVASVRALVHITSDGFLNLIRVKSEVGYIIDNLPPVPSIFSIVQQLGNVDVTQMYSVFNMGIGFCAIVAQEDADRAVSILSSNGKKAHRIGHAVSDAKRRVTLTKQGLIGQGKHFRRG
jgi:phosphoribosylformylglycinamidine cyclo-ligase